MFPLEVPVFSPHSAGLAIAHQAHRVELNRNGSYPQGGLTPTTTDLAALFSSSTVPAAPVRIMIRPRGPPADAPDFLYADVELEEMREAIRGFRESGHLRLEKGDGFVFGILKKKEEGDGMVVVDVERNSELVELARPFPCVFHRAFDDVLGSNGSTVEEALADLASCQFHGLLTSGGPGSAVNNIDTVSRIIRGAPGKLQEVIVGGGVRSSNIRTLIESLPVPEKGLISVWFHSSCLTSTGEGDIVDGGELQAIVKGLA